MLARPALVRLSMAMADAFAQPYGRQRHMAVATKVFFRYKILPRSLTPEGEGRKKKGQRARVPSRTDSSL